MTLSHPTRGPDAEPEDEDSGIGERGSMRSIEEIRAEAGTMGAEQFASTYGAWWLVKKPGKVDTHGDYPETVVRQAPRRAKQRESTWSCCPLAKRSTEPGGAITIGRGVKCDVVLRYARISRTHAVFSVDDDGRIYVADSGSANGTSLNGEFLNATPVQVSDGTNLDFGGVVLSVVSSASMHAALSY